MRGNSFSKVVIVFLAISLFFSLMPDSAKATSTQMKVTSDSLNVRSKPGTQYSKIGAFKKNQVVTVIEHQNSWSKVAYGKSYGWVSSSYLSPLTWNGYVNASSLSLRKAASTSSQSLASLPMGTILTVEGQQGSWLKVYVPSKKLRGWVYSAFVTKQAESTKKPEIGKTPASTNNLGTYYTTANSLNVRAQATTASSVLYTLSKQSSVQLLEKKGTWGKIKTAKGIGWASLSYLSKTLVDSYPETQSFVKDKVLVIDAGHGGKDGGTSGKNNLEKKLTLLTVQEVTTLLRQAGAKVILTREQDTYLTLSQRVDVSHKYNAVAFVSIHYNAAGSKSSGIMSFYYTSSKDLELAKSIQAGMIKETSMNDLGVRFGNFQVIRENKRPAILLELGFLSNPEEEKRISSSTFQKQVSRGIFNGIDQYFQKNR